jgi:hypothetical protein
MPEQLNRIPFCGNEIKKDRYVEGGDSNVSFAAPALSSMRMYYLFSRYLTRLQPKLKDKMTVKSFQLFLISFPDHKFIIQVLSDTLRKD